ncbi:permease, partial [mine drainage metagenome]
ASGVLTLGIGASVAVFTLIDQVLIKPLPLPDASRVMVVGRSEHSGVGPVSPLQYQHLRSLDGVISIGLAQPGAQVNIVGRGPPEVVSATFIDHTLLPTLGLHPVLGRNFAAQEDQPHGPNVVMLGYGFWRRRYDGNREVLGQALIVNGRAYTIVGVLPANFDALDFRADVVLPIELPANSTDDGTNYVAVAR